jgi:predicted transposase YbfD/YdcC
MIVTANQPQLRDHVARLFDLPAIAADQEHWDRVCTVNNGHGRREVRTLACTTGDGTLRDWPGAAQILRRSGERTILKTGKRTVTVTYGITSLPPTEADAALLETLWRGHWTSERGSHYVRDVTLGEDGNHMHTGNAPQALAALRNGLLALWRRAGWTTIADAVRTYAASVPTALAFIGVAPTLT